MVFVWLKLTLNLLQTRTLPWKIVILYLGQLVIWFVRWLFQILGDTVQVVLIDYARVRLYPSSAPVFLDALNQLNKYRSCGVWFEVVPNEQKKFVLGRNENQRARIVRKHICSNSR